MKRLLKAVEWLGTVLIGLIILVAVLLLLGPRLGWNTHPVLSGSMEPTLGVGGVIVTMPLRLDDIRVGDIITYRSGDQRVTHRVVEVVRKTGADRPSFRTKGDANSAPDANLVSPTGDWGAKAVLYVPYLGYLASSAQNKTVFPLLLGMPTLLLLVLFSREIWRGLMEEKAKRKGKCAHRES